MAAGRLMAVMAVVAVVAAQMAAAADGTTPCLVPPGNGALANQVAAQIEKIRPAIPDPVGPLPPIAFDVNTSALILAGSVSETTLHGVSDFVLCRINVSLGLSQKFDILFELDDIRLDGLYDIDGTAVSLFPIFGSGSYSLDIFNAGFEVSGAVSLNILSGKFTVKNLKLDLFYDRIEIFMECILGCGGMADFVNKHLSDVATAIVQAVWDFVSPTISAKLEDVINAALNEGKQSAPELRGALEAQLGKGGRRSISDNRYGN